MQMIFGRAKSIIIIFSGLILTFLVIRFLPRLNDIELNDKTICNHDKQLDNENQMQKFSNTSFMNSLIIEKKPFKTLSERDIKWLVVGIPTIPRMNNEDYLLQTLESIAEQLPTDPHDLLYHKVLIHIVHINDIPENAHHVMYEQAKSKYSHPMYKKREYFKFSSFTSREDYLSDPLPNRTALNDLCTPKEPGYVIRKQTRNLVTVIRKSLNYGSYYLFLEDDMLFCPNVLIAMQYLLKKASQYHPNWLAIRASYGMNGIFMHNSDLQVFAEYLLKHQHRRPPDHLVVEWYAGETEEAAHFKGIRKNIGFKYNLFNHIGQVSTLRSEKSGSFPRCYEELLVPTVFEVEAYNPMACPRDDIWPCATETAVPARDKVPIHWSIR